jgi:hypothetical protein
MSYKSILFFTILFGIILFGYFYYDIFIKYFPINIVIKVVILIFGLSALFFPTIIKKYKDGENFENIKKYIIEKYKKK